MTTTTNERDLAVARDVGTRIHLALWERRITKAHMAEQIGVSGSTFSKKLRGTVPLTVDELMTIARVLDVDAGDLLMGRARRDSNPKPSDP